MNHTTLIVLSGLAVFGLWGMWHSVRKSARKTAKAARHGAHAMSLLGRITLLATVITCAQWVIVRFVHDPTLLWVALALPALFAAATVIRATTITTVATHRGGRR